MIHILSHADADGYFASYAAQRYYRKAGFDPSEMKLYDVQYSEPFPFDIETLTEHDEVFILDFSYSREILESIWARTKHLVVLDHHKTAQAQLEGLSYALFDMTKSGALLAWEYFFPKEKVPDPCLYVNDRDLWKWEFGNVTKYFHAFVMTERFGSKYSQWDDVCFDQHHLSLALEDGKKYHFAESQMVERFVGNPKNMALGYVEFKELGKMRFCLYEGMGFLTSEVADRFLNDKELREKHKYQFTMEHRIRGDKMVFSLRSRAADACTDVSKIAQGFGGGGHVNAAGFALPIAEGLELLQTLYTKNP